jgi:hypothetical protein
VSPIRVAVLVTLTFFAVLTGLLALRDDEPDVVARAALICAGSCAGIVAVAIS